MLRHIPELRSAEISGTPIHPVWSLDANDWIQLSELKTGEQLKTRAGAVSIAAIETHHWSQAVYNIEVHTEHVYEIGESGVLVHNATIAVNWEER